MIKCTEESASPAWLASSIMNASNRDAEQKYTSKFDIGHTRCREHRSHKTPEQGYNNTRCNTIVENCASFPRQREMCDIIMDQYRPCTCSILACMLWKYVWETTPTYSTLTFIYLRTVLVVYLSVPFLLKSSYTLLLETVCIPPLTSLICEIKTLLILWKYQVILVITYIFIIKVINYAL